MASGNKRLVINTRERAISDDIQRLQSFAAADRSAWNRRMLDDLYVNDVNAGFGFPTDTITNPLTADVIGGLMVQPVIGSPSLIVTPGVLGTYFPDPIPSNDDDPYKVISDPGVQTLGVLTIDANPGPGIRIDVIECQPVEVVEEQDNRDIFDKSTGLFTPALVDKVVAGRLTYRVRKGTAGGGFPGTATGWLPLAVASVASGSTSTDSVTFWDVRPLIADRWEPPIKGGSLLGNRTRMVLKADPLDWPSTLRVRGNVSGGWGSYKMGGTLSKGTPTIPMGSGDVPWIDAMDSDNWEPGLTPIGNYPGYLWALYPFGLNRWVRYTENDFLGQGRVPGSMRGIPTFSMVPPAGFANTPALPIGIPASTGLGGSTSFAAMIAATSINTSNLPGGFVSDGLVTYLQSPNLWLPINSDNWTDEYLFIDNMAYPANARSLILRFESYFTGAPGTNGYYYRQVEITDSSFNDTLIMPYWEQRPATVPGTGFFYDNFTVEVPLPTIWPNTGARTVPILVTYNTSSGLTRTNGHARIHGWRLGP